MKANNLFSILLILFIAGSTGCASTGGAKGEEAIVLYQKANQYYSQGLFTEAEAEYLKMTKLYPKYYESYLKLGNIYTRTDQLDAAIRVYEIAAKLRPNNEKVWNNLALVRVKQAIKYLEEGKTHMDIGSSSYLAFETTKSRIIKTMAE